MSAIVKNITEYRTWCTQWATELFRTMKPGGYVLVFNSTRTIAHVQVALEDAGFYARDISSGEDIRAFQKESTCPKN